MFTHSFASPVKVKGQSYRHRNHEGIECWDRNHQRNPKKLGRRETLAKKIDREKGQAGENLSAHAESTGDEELTHEHMCTDGGQHCECRKHHVRRVHKGLSWTRLRQAGAKVFDCEQRRDPGLACNRVVSLVHRQPL